MTCPENKYKGHMLASLLSLTEVVRTLISKELYVGSENCVINQQRFFGSFSILNVFIVKAML